MQRHVKQRHCPDFVFQTTMVNCDSWAKQMNDSSCATAVVSKMTRHLAIEPSNRNVRELHNERTKPERKAMTTLFYHFVVYRIKCNAVTLKKWRERGRNGSSPCGQIEEKRDFTQRNNKGTKLFHFENEIFKHSYKKFNQLRGRPSSTSRCFGPIFTTPPAVTLCHTSRDPLKYVTHLGTPNF